MKGLNSLAIASATLLALSATAQSATITGSIADYEPRMERPTATSSPFYVNDQDDLTGIEDGSLGVGNIEIPSEAQTLRVGGQARHRMSSAFFFQLPTLSSGQTFDTAGLSFDTVNPGGGSIPSYNGDLWVVGVYNNISTANDPDASDNDAATIPQEMVGNGLSSQLYLESNTDSAAGLNTPVARLKLVDNFLSGTADFNGQAKEYTSLATDPTGLANYLNALYAAGDVAGQYLVVRINPDAQPSTSTNRFFVASADNTNESLRPALSYTVVPEPGAVAMAGLAAGGLLLRRRK